MSAVSTTFKFVAVVANPVIFPDNAPENVPAVRTLVLGLYVKSVSVDVATPDPVAFGLK